MTEVTAIEVDSAYNRGMTTYAQPAGEVPKNPYVLISDVAKEVQPPDKGILSQTLFNDDNLKIILFGFAAGNELTAHTAPMPATLHFLQGEATLSLGTETREVRAGALVHMQPQLTHGIVAKTPVTMLLYLIKAARRN